MRSDNRQYRPELDVLRAIAAWWVVGYHVVIRYTPAGPLPYMWTGARNTLVVALSQGWLAVSIFVVLSGYSLSLGLSGREVSWSKYLAARWLRLAPLYLLVLGVALIVLDGVSTGRRSLVASLSLLPLPNAWTPGPYLATAWSVRLEFALGLTLPVMVWLARRRSAATVLVAVGVVAVAVMVFQGHHGASGLTILYFGLPGRVAEFALGFALGWSGTTVGRGHRRLLQLAAGTGLIVVAHLANDAGGLLVLQWRLRGVLYLATLLLCGTLVLASSATTRSRPGPPARALAQLGSWSYSTYLWHAVVINVLVAPRLFDRTPVAGFRGTLLLGLSVTALVTVPLSWISFTFVERPFLRLRPRYAAPIPHGEAGTQASSASLETAAGTGSSGQRDVRQGDACGALSAAGPRPHRE